MGWGWGVMNNMIWPYKRKIWSSLLSHSYRDTVCFLFFLNCFGFKQAFYSGIHSAVTKYHDTPQGSHTISIVAPNSKHLCVLYFLQQVYWVGHSNQCLLKYLVVESLKGDVQYRVRQLKRSAGHNKIWSICGIPLFLCPSGIVPFDWHVAVFVYVGVFKHVHIH